MKKYALLFVVVVLGIYLNRSYARIYDTIERAHLTSPDTQQTYTIGENPHLSNSTVYTAIGDSITAGVGVSDYKQSFPYVLAETISSKDNVIILHDRAYPGYKTQDVKALLDAVIADTPNIITLEIGLNDIHGNVSKKEFEDNYAFILNRLTQETKAKIYIVSIPRVGAPSLLLPPYNYYFNWKTKQFNEVIRDLAKEKNITYVELPDVTEYSSDLFHPSALGYTEWAHTIHDNFN